MKAAASIANKLKQASEQRQTALAECAPSTRHMLPNIELWQALLERENNHIANELHNDLGQMLTALKLDISLFRLQHEQDGILVEKANKMLDLTDVCMQKVSTLINTLRISDHQQDMASALECLCLNFGKRHNIACALIIQCDSCLLHNRHTAAIVRILQEALSNIARHAASHSASININGSTENGLQIEIHDDGCGFDTSSIAGEKHLGFLLMRECALALGAHLRIESKISQGTTIILNIPPESSELKNTLPP